MPDAYSPAEIIARLEAGEDPATMATTLVPSEIRTALHYAAPLRWLTNELWETVISAHQPGVSLSELRRRDLIREYPREPGRYALSDETRALHLAEWAPDELKQYSRELTKVFETDDRERVYHLMLSDLDAALALFEKLFTAADASFDLAAARDLLELFERPERRQLVDSKVSDKIAGWRALLDTRGAWSTDFYRSAGFLERPMYGDLLEDLLKGTRFRELQLVAMGGMGKTMMIRSFIARRCIPAKIVVARIDFDDIDPLIATQHPWLIRLALAQQLNGQSPDRPFESLLADRRRLLPALYRDAGLETSAALRELITLGDTSWLEKEVTSRYQYAMKRLGESDIPLVFIFDTLEVPVLRSDLDAKALVDTLIEIYRGANNARLLLAGRYDISGLVGRATEPWGLRLRTVQLEAFTESEARTYLAKVRGVDRPEIVEAIVSKRDLMPFTLALYGDLACDGEGLTVADVESFEEPKQLYLIERVLERIDDKAVLYALRYGVVARRLDKRFLDKVLMPYIEPALRGKHVEDDPELDPHTRLRARFRIEDVSAHTADSNTLWQRLESYAASQSWVSFVQDAGEFLSFHPNVREPMRLVLEHQAVLRGLHERAFLYFRSLMDEQPLRVMQWAEEAAYHLFQSRGPSGEESWHKLLVEVELVAGAAARGDLAAALTADVDIATNHGQQASKWFDDQRVISVQTLANAHLEVALARLRVPAYFDNLAWTEIQSRLSTIDAMERRTGRALVDSQRRTAVELALQARDGNRDSLEHALGVLGRTEDSIVVEALEGIILSYAGSIGVERLTVLAEHQVSNPEVASSLHMILASLFLAEGECIAAEVHASHAAAILGDDALIDFRVWMALAQAAPTQASRLLAVQPPSIGVVVKQGRAALLAQRPEAALEASGRLAAIAATPDRTSIQEEAATAAVIAELNGRCSAAWGDTDAAVRWLDEAVSHWRDAGDLLREADVRAITARILLDAGRIFETRRHLEAADRLSVPEGHDLWVTTHVLKARWLDRSGRESEAGLVLRDLVNELEMRPRGPAALAHVAVEGLAGGSAHREDYLRLLAQAVSKFRPADAAIAALDGIDRCRPIYVEYDDVLAPLVRLLEVSDSPGQYSVGDYALRCIRLADLARVLGLRDLASRWLSYATATAATTDADPGSLVPLRLLEAAARLRQPIPNVEAVTTTFVLRHISHPAIALDALVAWAKAVPPIYWGQRLNEMLELLKRAGAPSRRNAEVMQLRAEAAWSAIAPGDPNELNELVSRLYRTLGDEAALRDLVGASKQTDPDPNKSRKLQHSLSHILDVEVVDENGMMTLTSGSTHFSQPIMTKASTWQAGSSRLFSQPRDLLEELRPPLAQFAAESADVRLRITSPHLTELPWELAWPAGNKHIIFRAAPSGRMARVMRVQRALSQSGHDVFVDGVVGPDTESAISDYLYASESDMRPDIESSRWDSGPQPITALILSQMQTKRGKYQTTGVAADYDRAGFSTFVVDDPSSLQLSHLSSACSVVHIQASLESRGDAAHLSFNSNRTVRQSESGLEFSAEVLSQLLLQINKGLGPVVVLEAMAPESRLEIMRQVLLRNLFASDLFEKGNAAAVLAIGPFPDDVKDMTTKLLAPALAGRITPIGDIGELYRIMRTSHWDPILLDHFSVPALFVEEPGAVRLR